MTERRAGCRNCDAVPELVVKEIRVARLQRALTTAVNLLRAHGLDEAAELVEGIATDQGKREINAGGV